MALNLSEFCIYTIVHRDKLAEAAQHGQSEPFTEQKAWVTGFRLWKKAQEANLDMAVLLGDATDCSQLLYWGLLTKVERDGSATHFTVDKVRRLKEDHAPQELILRSTRKNIAPYFIRPYAICVTPEFLE